MADATEARRLYLRAGALWVALLVLMGVSLAGALLLAGAWATLVPLGSAAIMTVLVGLRFMELPKAGAISLLSALAGVLFLAVMFTLTFADEMTRDHVPAGFAPEDRR